MVLRVNHQLLGRDQARRATVPPLTVSGALTGIGIPVPEGARELMQTTKVFVVSVVLTRQEDMQPMMEIVAPLSIQSIPAQLLWEDQAWVIEITLGNEIKAPI